MCDHCHCRDNRPIAELSAEHEEILRVAWSLSEHVRLAGATDAALRDELLDMLQVHVAAEEQALYPLLVASGGLDRSQSAVLEDEHEALRTSLLAGTFDRRTYYELAAHIEAEEMELFPAAMFGFDDEAWDLLAATPRFVAVSGVGS